MLQTSSQRRYPFVYPQCPALAFYGSLTGNWATCLVGYISEDNSHCVPGLSYPLIRVLVSFPSLIGTNPACSLFLFSLCAPTMFPVPVICCQSFKFPQPNWH